MSTNALKHGLHSVSPTAGGEPEEEWLEFLEGFRADFKPVGTPQEALVLLLAIDSWREFRAVRAQGASIDALYSAIKDPASYPDPPPEPFLPVREYDLNTLADAHRVLTAFLPENSPDELSEEEDWGMAAEVLNFMGCVDQIPDSDSWTKDTFQDALYASAQVHDSSVEDHVTYALIEIEDSYDQLQTYLEERAAQMQRHEAAVDRRRRQLEREAILATASMESTVQRIEAHLSKRKQRTLGELELLQRARSGESTPVLRLRITE